jgi:restriction system protein
MNSQSPDYQRLIQPTLNFLQKAGDFVQLEEISDTLTETLSIPIIELEELLPSGRQTIFENQLQWAISYLVQDDLVESDGEGGYRFSRKQKALSVPVSPQLIPSLFSQASLDCQLAQAAPDRVKTSSDRQKLIANEFEIVQQQLAQDLIKRIHEQPPEFFENLIIDLLLAMGYGNRRRDLSQHLGRSGDGGIDGAIAQDQLGLDVVYVQAKRYRPGNSVPVSAVRDFAGALESHKANKGVLVTTSHFTRASRNFIKAVSRRIVLINGQRLANLLIRNNVGVRIHETWEIKRVDEDYFPAGS